MPSPASLRALLGITPLNVVGDLPNLDLDFTDEEEALTRHGRDPKLRALIESNALDPFTQSILVRRDDQRIRTSSINDRIDRLENPEKSEEGMVAWLGPIPLGFQFGTYFGIENPALRFLVDLVTDPLMFVGGIGGFTKIGQGLRFLSKTGTALSPAQRGSMLMQGIRVIGQSSAHPQIKKELIRAAGHAKKTGNMDPLLKRLRELSRDPLDEVTMQRLADLGDEDLVRIARGEKKALKEFEAAFTQFDENSVRAAKTSFLDAVIAGERSFVDVFNPVSAIRGDGFFTPLSFSEITKRVKDKGVTGFVGEGITATAKVPGYLKDLFFAEKKTLEKALDITDSAVLQEKFVRTAANLRGVMDGTLAEGITGISLGPRASYAAGEVITRFHADRDLLAAGVNDLRAASELLLKDVPKETREKLSRMFEGVTLEELTAVPGPHGLSPRIQAIQAEFNTLPQSAQIYVREMRGVLDSAGEELHRLSFLRDGIEGYWPRVLQNRNLTPEQFDISRMLRAKVLKQKNPLDKEVLQRIREADRLGEPVDSDDLKQFIGDFFSLVAKQNTRDPATGGFRFLLQRLFDTEEELLQYLKKDVKGLEFNLDLPARIDSYLKSTGEALLRERTVKALRIAPLGPGVRTRLKPELRRGAIVIDDLDDLRQGKEVLGGAPIPGWDNLTAAERAKLGRELKDEAMRASGKKWGEFHRLDTINNAFEGVLLHDSVFADMNAVFAKDAVKGLLEGKTATAKVLRGLDFFNSAFKATIFSLNPLFHATQLAILSNFAELPAGAAAQGFKEVMSTTKDVLLTNWRESAGVRDFFNRLADPERTWELALSTVRKTPAGGDGTDMIDLMNASGLRLGRSITGEEGYNAIVKSIDVMLESVGDDFFSKALTHPLNFLKNFNAINDKFLWNITQNTIKTNAFVNMYHISTAKRAKELGRNLSQAEKFRVAEAVSKSVNGALGNLAWERLGATPFFQSVARRAVLAPDWTASNYHQAVDLLANIPGVHDGPIKTFLRGSLEHDLRFRYALGYNIRAAFYGTAGANLLNYYFTSQTGEGRWLHENDDESFDDATGMKSRVELPWTRADGRKQYMDIFRSFTEPMKLLTNTAEAFEAKMGSIPRAFRTVILGQDGFGNPVYGEEDGGMARLVKSFGELGLQMLPISSQQAGRLVRGDISGPGFALSTAGFPVRSESLKGFQRKLYVEELRRQLMEANR